MIVHDPVAYGLDAVLSFRGSKANGVAMLQALGARLSGVFRCLVLHQHIGFVFTASELAGWDM